MIIHKLKPQIKKFLLNQSKIFDNQQTEEGFTLVECLLAILVVTVVLSFISPLMILSVASRLQNRRVEQAINIAQSEIDRIQVLMSQGVSIANEGNLPPVTVNNVDAVAAPTTTISTIITRPNQTPYATNTNQVRRLDADGDGDVDFLIQTFRDQGARYAQGIAGGQLAVFRMGVRVYASVAEDNLGSLETDLAGMTFNTDIGDQRNKPLALVYSEVSRSDLDLSLETYRTYIDGL